MLTPEEWDEWGRGIERVALEARERRKGKGLREDTRAHSELMTVEAYQARVRALVVERDALRLIVLDYEPGALRELGVT
jgi:hypothetical protein